MKAAGIDEGFAPSAFVILGQREGLECPTRGAVAEFPNVVWAVNKSWLTQNLEEAFSSMPNGEEMRQSWYSRIDHSTFNSLFVERRPKIQLITALNPFKTNDRLLIQQGLFLCSTDIGTPFEEVLIAIPESRANVRRFHIVNSDARNEILLRLHRTAVNRSSLFPGLQGFAESLRPKVLLFRHLQNLRDKTARMGPATIGV